MGWLSSILRALAPIAVEHGSQVLRDSLRSRAAQGQAATEAPHSPDLLQQLAGDMDQIKRYAMQMRSDLEALNTATAAREEKLRKWLLALVIWNAVMTAGLIVLAVFALRH